MEKPYDETSLLNFTEVSKRQQNLLQEPNIILWSSDSNEEKDQQPHLQILQRDSFGQRRSSSGKLATKIKRSVLSLVSSNSQNVVRTEGGLMMDDSCTTSSEVGFTVGGFDPYEVAVPINKRTSSAFPLATPITPSPTLRQGSSKIAALLAPSQCESKKSKQNNSNEDSPTNSAFNPFDVTPDNTFLDVSNSQNIITPLKLWPNDNIGDLTFTIADDTSPTTTIQPQQTPLQHELSTTIQKTKSSQLFENLTASRFNAFTEFCPTKTVDHGNMTNNLSKFYNPSTIDSKKTSDVRHPSPMENSFCTKDITEVGSSTATIPSINKRFEKSDTVVTKNNATSNVTTGCVPSNPTKRSVHTERVLADGKDNTVQDVLATTTISTTSIENGFAVKGGKEAATTAKKDKTVAQPKTTNDQSISKDPYFTTQGDVGKSMEGKDEIFLLPTSTLVSSPTKQVYIEVFNKNAQTLSPCSQLVEVEVNHRLDDSIDACCPLKFIEDISVIDADVSDRFHFMDIGPFTSTSTQNLHASDFDSCLRHQPNPVDAAAGAPAYSVENNLIGGSREAVNAVSSILRSGCDIPARENNIMTEDNGVPMQFHQEPKKSDKRVKFQEKASVHLLYNEEGTHGTSSTTTLDGIRSTLQYFFRKMNCAEATTSPNKYQGTTYVSSLQSNIYMNEQSFMDDVGYEVYLNDTGDENKYHMQQLDSLKTTTKQLILEGKNSKALNQLIGVEKSFNKTAEMPIARNERNDHSESSINSLQLTKEPSDSSNLNGNIYAENISDGASSNDELGSKSSMERISDWFDACHTTNVLEIEGTVSHQIQTNNFNSTVAAVGGFHTPVRQETPEEKTIRMNPTKPTKLSPRDKKKPKSLTSLIDGCQYPMSFDSDNGSMASLYNNSYFNVLQGFHTPEPRDVCDIELLNNSTSTEKRSNANKTWLGESTLGAVLDVCRSPLEYNKDDMSEPSSVSFSPVNEPSHFVDVPTFKELSVIPEETSNYISSILEDLEGVALVAATQRDFITPLQRKGSSFSSSSSRKKRMSSGKLSNRSHINSCSESKDSSKNSTISTTTSLTDSFTTTKLSLSQDEWSVAVDKSLTLSTASSDDPGAAKIKGMKSMHNLEKDKFELESEPGPLPISGLRVGIRPLLLDTACLSPKAPPSGNIEGLNEKVERVRTTSKYRSTSIRAQVRIILEQRRYNIRRTKSESNISTPMRFPSAKNYREPLKQVTEGDCSQEVAPSSNSCNCNETQQEVTYSVTTLPLRKKQIEDRPHNSNETSPEENEQRISPMERKPTEQFLSASSERAKSLKCSQGQGSPRPTSIENSANHDVLRTANGSDREFIPSIIAALQESDSTNHCNTERTVQQRTLYNEKDSTDKEKTQSIFSGDKTLIRSHVHSISIPFQVKEKEEHAVNLIGEIKYPHRLIARRSVQLDENTTSVDLDSNDEKLEKNTATEHNAVFTFNIKDKIAMFEKNKEPFLKQTS